MAPRAARVAHLGEQPEKSPATWRRAARHHARAEIVAHRAQQAHTPLVRKQMLRMCAMVVRSRRQ